MGIPEVHELIAELVAQCQSLSDGRLARHRRAEAEAEGAARAAKEEAEQKIEDEQGANPLYNGQEYALWDFRRLRFPQGTIFSGHVSSSSRDSIYCWQVEPQGFI